MVLYRAVCIHVQVNVNVGVNVQLKRSVWNFLLISSQQLCTMGTTCFLMERSAWPRPLQGSMPAPTIAVCPQVSWLPRHLLRLGLIWELPPAFLKLLPWLHQLQPPLTSPPLLLRLVDQKPGRNNDIPVCYRFSSTVCVAFKLLWCFDFPTNSLKLESQVSSQAAAIIPPPPDIQPVIDKLAEYVARNGLKFEASVRAKNDPRWVFRPTPLRSWF